MEKKSVLQQALDFVFGTKYYINIVRTRGVDMVWVSSEVFKTKKQADRHKESLSANLSYMFVETISFRSKKI